MNRQQRRALQRQKFTYEETRAMLLQECVDTNHHNTRMILGAACLALHRKWGFGAARCYNFLTIVQEITENALCASEINEQVEREIGHVFKGEDEVL